MSHSSNQISCSSLPLTLDFHRPSCVSFSCYCFKFVDVLLHIMSSAFIQPLHFFSCTYTLLKSILETWLYICICRKSGNFNPLPQLFVKPGFSFAKLSLKCLQTTVNRLSSYKTHTLGASKNILLVLETWSSFQRCCPWPRFSLCNNPWQDTKRSSCGSLQSKMPNSLFNCSGHKGVLKMTPSLYCCVLSPHLSGVSGLRERQ